MNCPVCRKVIPAESLCPVCGWDSGGPNGHDPAAVLAAREAFKARTLTYAPDSRVTLRDKVTPWLGLGLGAVLLLFVLAACHILL